MTCVACNGRLRPGPGAPGECRVCYIAQGGDPAVKPGGPGIFRRAANFAGAVAGHMLAGAPMVSPDDKAKRLAVCEACPLYDRGTCRDPSCGCKMEVKAGWASQDCPQGRWPQPGLSATWPRLLSHRNLHPSAPGLRFNPSIARWEDGYVFAWRTGWAGSDVYITRLDWNYRATGDPVKLNLYHAKYANYGREDPRLFVHRGKLHTSYIGVQGARGSVIRTHQLHARLGPGFRVDAVFAPQYHPRRSWEKNWAMFSRGNDLLAVYTISPHRIIRLDGDTATLIHETENPAPWSGGDRRGGAAPVLVGNEYYHWFHDRIGPDSAPTYRMGLYTFDASPPFTVRRAAGSPIAAADWTTKPRDQYAAVIFPGGAILDGGAWVIACGVHDRWSELHGFGFNLTESLLRPAGQAGLVSPASGPLPQPGGSN